MERAINHIRLSLALGAGCRAASLVCTRYPDLSAFLEGGETEWKLSGLVSARQIARLHSVSREDARRVYEKAIRLGFQVLTPWDAAYPSRLRNIEDFPVVLYVWGALPDIDNLISIAMVGTRNASNYGARAADMLASGITKAGALVVSGAALGVDSAAHKAALLAGGKTVAVLGCGLDTPYLISNLPLRREIAANGAVISEFPPGYPAGKSTFPIRNRIISGLCLGTVVIEAGIRSGSLVTAKHALRQGRDVFVVPGSILSPQFEGTNQLLRDGCKPVAEPYDILAEYEERYGAGLRIPEPNAAASTPDPPFPPPQLTHDESYLYSILSNRPRPLDDLCAASGLPVSSVVSALTSLELKGGCELLPGGLYRKK